MKSKIYLILVMLVSLSILLNAHSGRTDSKGGHNNRKTGGYHYHGFRGGNITRTLVIVGIMVVVGIVFWKIDKEIKKPSTKKNINKGE